MKRNVGAPELQLADLLDRQAPDNSKDHDVPMIAESLALFGYVRRIQLNRRDGLILAGHGTAQAMGWLRSQAKEAPRNVAVREGVWWVPVDWDDLPAGRARAYRIADNRATELGGWDDSRLLKTLQGLTDTERHATGFDEVEIRRLMRSLGEVEPEPAAVAIDQADQLRRKWKVRRGQLWIAGPHRILCGDCTEAASVGLIMANNRYEMIFTDPPYGVSVGDKNKYLNSIARSNRIEENLSGDTLDEAGLERLLALAFDNAVAVGRAGAAWYVAAPPGPLHVLFGLALKNRGIWRQTIQWIKNNATFAPLGVDYHWRCEPIFYGWLPNAAHRFHGGRQQDTVWNIDRPSASPEHPTMKPVDLVARAIENSSRMGDIVFDPFLGSGTTVVACERLGRRGFGIEIEPKYVGVTLERLADLGLKPKLAEAASARRRA